MYRTVKVLTSQAQLVESLYQPNLKLKKKKKCRYEEGSKGTVSISGQNVRSGQYSEFIAYLDCFNLRV